MLQSTGWAGRLLLPQHTSRWTRPLVMSEEADSTVHPHTRGCDMSPLTLGAGSALTLQAALHRTLGGAGGAELVDHAGDVLHLAVHHGLDVVHVEQVQALQPPLQHGDLVASVTQAGRHPFQFDLRPTNRERSGMRNIGYVRGDIPNKHFSPCLTSKIGKINSMDCTH